jgi:hypothetical protein
MKNAGGTLALLALIAASAACSRASEKAEAPGPELASYVLSDVPKDIEHSTFIDFGGKVHLVGYNLEPKGVASPGSKVKLTLFWRSHQRLGPGWSLFTHLVAPGVPPENIDKAGPLRKLVSAGAGAPRQALGPSLWEPGRVYVDELEFDVPKNVDAPEVTVLAGLWQELPAPESDEAGSNTADAGELSQPDVRLQVLSGPSDGSERGVVAHIRTGLERRAQSPRTRTASPAKSR